MNNQNKSLFISIVVSLACISFTQAATIVPDGYAYNTTIDNQSDPGGLLTDGEVGEGSWNGGDYVGFGDDGLNAWASITFSFDDVYDFETVDLFTYSSFTAGYVEISTSTDNVSFSSPTQFILSNTAVGGTKTSVTDSLTVTALASAQHIKIDWFKTPEYPGAGNWVFISEASFSAVPESSSFALLAGMFGLTAVMLRRRS